jgi:hypothetical protein
MPAETKIAEASLDQAIFSRGRIAVHQVKGKETDKERVVPDARDETGEGGKGRPKNRSFFPKKEFEVGDVIVLSGPGLVVELSRKTYKKPQGSHISNLDFTVPPGLPPGSYKLISTIRAAGQEKQQGCNFIVKGKEND